MKRISIEDIEPVADSATIKRPITNVLEAANVAINYYELGPGDSFAYGYHKHEGQEEIFIIQSGTVTFETENRELEVGEGEIIRFAPGEYQQGKNRGDDRVEAIALGAPQETGESEILRYCENCDKRTSQTVTWNEDGEEKQIYCDECGMITGRYD